MKAACGRGGLQRSRTFGFTTLAARWRTRPSSSWPAQRPAMALIRSHLFLRTNRNRRPRGSGVSTPTSDCSAARVPAGTRAEAFHLMGCIGSSPSAPSTQEVSVSEDPNMWRFMPAAMAPLNPAYGQCGIRLYPRKRLADSIDRAASPPILSCCRNRRPQSRLPYPL